MMSGCSDVCLDRDLDFYNEFYADGTRTAKIDHACGECGRTINPGEKYHRAVGKAEGYWFVAKTCPECEEIRKALVCGEYFFDHLWDDIREYVYPKLRDVGPSECFAMMETKSAREKLAADFTEWLATESL